MSTAFLYWIVPIFEIEKSLFIKNMVYAMRHFVKNVRFCRFFKKFFLDFKHAGNQKKNRLRDSKKSLQVIPKGMPTGK